MCKRGEISFHFKNIYPGYNSVYKLFYNWPCKSYLQNKKLYNTKFTIKIIIKNNVYDYFSLSLDLKALIEGAIFVSKSRMFQRLAPRYAKDFWPLPVLNMGIARSVFEFLNSLGSNPDNLTKRSLRY